MSIQSVAEQSLTREFNQAEWESQLEATPGIRRITEDSHSTLRRLLDSCENEDSYVTSPIYYAFTGRLGLWVYEKNGAFVLLCWHPNVSGQVLIFSQLTNHQVDLVSKLMGIIPIPKNGIKIARTQPRSHLNHLEQHYNQRDIKLNECEEQVLDWKFPVRILSTADVAATTGSKFMYIRNRLRQLKIVN
jgi:hypothetical protein